METKRKIVLSYLTFVAPKDKLSALQKVRGLWKNRKSDPIKELKKIRAAWER